MKDRKKKSFQMKKKKKTLNLFYQSAKCFFKTCSESSFFISLLETRNSKNNCYETISCRPMMVLASWVRND
jgi:hypothetical protein